MVPLTVGIIGIVSSMQDEEIKIVEIVEIYNKIKEYFTIKD